LYCRRCSRYGPGEAGRPSLEPRNDSKHPDIRCAPSPLVLARILHAGPCRQPSWAQAGAMQAHVQSQSRPQPVSRSNSLPACEGHCGQVGGATHAGVPRLQGGDVAALAAQGGVRRAVAQVNILKDIVRRWRGRRGRRGRRVEHRRLGSWGRGRRWSGRLGRRRPAVDRQGNMWGHG